ncbi:helix-turn-helix domain-containing protein [Halorussus halophilus]|uniref:helix-turn-helix domain-containing protein n=1 Tax=Halorussus halophilus TaxID=2650975 RepID=UPI001300FED9|nr:helix-turn-helix domain-containing protein [Halorussus halophilus]
MSQRQLSGTVRDVRDASGGQVRSSPSRRLTREAKSGTLLADDTVFLFAEGSGNRDRYEQIMQESPRVVDSLVSGRERWMAVSQFEPTDTTRRMLQRERESDVAIDMPIRITADGALRITYVGSESAFREMYRSVTDEDSVQFEVVETGEYEPDETSFTRLLTTRQQEVLDAAVTVGYYRAPREATHEDVAEVVGIAPTTVGEHLRKIEERVFGALVR